VIRVVNTDTEPFTPGPIRLLLDGRVMCGPDVLAEALIWIPGQRETTGDEPGDDGIRLAETRDGPGTVQVQQLMRLRRFQPDFDDGRVAGSCSQDVEDWLLSRARGFSVLQGGVRDDDLRCAFPSRDQFGGLPPAVG